MQAQLELIVRTNDRPGCNFSQSPIADTWLVNLRITESERFSFVYCDECSRQTCYRNTYRKLVLLPN
jgi:hypothetical protein